MLRKHGLLILALGLALTIPAAPAAAQTVYQAWNRYALPVYGRPGRSNPIVGVWVPKTMIELEARNADATWVLGHSLDGRVRGWVESRYLAYPDGVNITTLLVSYEAMFVFAPSPSDYRQVTLSDYPILPVSLGQARDIFLQGQILGMDAHVVSKIGDCMTDNVNFLTPFGMQQYQLGVYTGLQGVISQFSISLAYDSLAAYDGLLTSTVLDPQFADPKFCLPGETPLRCEYRVHRPGVAVIMFGAQDLLYTPPDAFDRNLRQIVYESIQAGVVPLVSTFPSDLKLWDRTVQYNQIVVQVALDYNVPLLNLWWALEALPNHGVGSDNRHLSRPITGSGDLTQPNLQRGYPLRNLITLQALDVIWRGAMY